MDQGWDYFWWLHTKWKVVHIFWKLFYSSKFLSRWDDGPPLNEVSPVLIEFLDKKDKLDVYGALRSGLENTNSVVTEDSR